MHVYVCVRTCERSAAPGHSLLAVWQVTGGPPRGNRLIHVPGSQWPSRDSQLRTCIFSTFNNHFSTQQKEEGGELKQSMAGLKVNCSESEICYSFNDGFVPTLMVPFASLRWLIFSLWKSGPAAVWAAVNRFWEDSDEAALTFSPSVNHE